MTDGGTGRRAGSPKPEAVLKYANMPIAMLRRMWEKMSGVDGERSDPRPPVFILVCKNTRIAKVL